MDPIEVLSFLLTLGSLELGCDYSSGIVVFNADHHLDVLSDSEKIMLIEMKHLGLIYQRKV
jgi:transcription initiation factor TFIIH subunit 4